MWAWFMCAFALILCVLQGAEIWTPVLLASYENQIDVLEILIQHSAQLDVRNEVSVTIVLSTHYCALINC